MSLRQHGNKHAFQKMVLADDDLFDFVKNALHELRNVGAAGLFVIHGSPSQKSETEGRRPRTDKSCTAVPAPTGLVRLTGQAPLPRASAFWLLSSPFCSSSPRLTHWTF